VDVRFPSWALNPEEAEDPFITHNMPVSIDDVRLVVTLEDEGRQYEVIAKHVYGGRPFLQRSNAQTPKHTRYIAGENIPIPWPDEGRVDNMQDEEGDTSRKEVEHETWTPSIERPPFNPFILDELRNKFSKYRSRHDPMWLENRKLEDLREEYLKSRTLLTPAGEHRAKIAKQKEAIRQSKLDENGHYIMDTTTSEFIAQFVGRQAPKKQKANKPSN
jgi:large subunit ribosomal protein L24